MVNDLDDLEPAGGLRAWRGRLIALGIVVVVAAAGGYALWTTTLKSSASTVVKTQTQAVARGTIRQTVSTTGTVSAQSSTSLSFQETGRVTAVNVQVGQQVKQGDVLAQVDTTDLQNAVQSAQANLTSAQVKLHQLEQGATASDLATADQSVVQAQAAYDKANSDLATLTGPPAAADESAAQSAVTAAQSQLTQAQAALTTLEAGPNASDLTAAQSAVTSAQAAVTAAENGEQNAQNGVTSAQASLFAAESGYCVLDTTPQFCASRAAPVSDGDRALLLSVTQTPVALPTGTPQAGGGGGSITSSAAAVLGSNTSYQSAANSAENAAGSVTSAQAALASAQAKLTALQAGPSASALTAAQSAVTVAQDGLDVANAKLSTLNGGPSQADLTAAQDAVNSANAGLNAAQAKRDLVAAGSTSDDIKLQQTSVELAQLSVASAQDNLKKTQIIAPYDGTVASLNVHVGDMAGSGGGSSSTGGAASSSSSAPIVIDTPDAVQLQLTLGETDVTSVKVGDRGVATFDAMPGQSFPFTIDSIGGIPAVSQGVVTYTAQATMLTGAAAVAAGFGPGGALSGFGQGAGLSGPGRTGGFARRTPGAGRTPRAGGTPFAGRTPGAGFGGLAQPGAAATAAAAPKPLPGMSASAVIAVQQATNVLEVPATAVKRQGLNSVVDVMQADGTTKTVVIETGLTDGTNIEVTSGVNEGDKVVLPSLAVSTGGSTNVSTTTGAASGAGGRGGGGGGGRFGGGGAGIAAPSNGIPGGVR